jgi:hypothetical protein
VTDGAQPEPAQPEPAQPEPPEPARRRWWSPAPLLWAIPVACFGLLYVRLDRAAGAAGVNLPEYLAAALSQVYWLPWVALMVPYCLLYVLLDAMVLWRVVSWSLVPVRYCEILPVRAAAYVLSIVNEQVGKGAIALALRRRHRVPLTAAASSLLFIMVGEYLSLLGWATAGVLLRGDRLPDVFRVVPWLAAGSLVAVCALHLAATRTAAGRDLCRRRHLWRAFGAATGRRYVEVVALRAPLMAAAVGAYTVAVRLFGVPVGFGEMLGYLPVVLFGAATPGPLRSVAVVLWVLLFPQYPAQMAAFGLLQHALFSLINAVVGMAFLRRATRELGAAPG